MVVIAAMVKEIWLHITAEFDIIPMVLLFRNVECKRHVLVGSSVEGPWQGEALRVKPKFQWVP